MSDYPVKRYLSWPAQVDESGKRYDLTDREMLRLFYDVVEQRDDLTAQLATVTAERDALQTLVSEGNLRAESLRAEILRIEAERDEWVDNYADAFTGDCRHLAELSELRARVERV